MGDSTRFLSTRESSPERDLLIEAVLESDGGPSSGDDEWEAANIADDIMATAAWERLVALIRSNR